MQDYDIIETPENVELQRRLAGIGTRLIAGLLDTILIFLIFLALFLLFWLTGLDIIANWGSSNEVGTWVMAILILVGFLIYWGYFVFFEMWTNGQSPGKKYMKIRVVQVEGSGISFGSIAIRNLLRAVDFLAFYAVAGIAMFVTKKVQRLGDLAAGTVVISEELLDYAASYDKKTKVFDNGEIGSAALEATGLTPEEYHLLNNYWLRRSQLNIEIRSKLLPKILKPIIERTGQSLPNEYFVTLENYVEKILAKAKSANFDDLEKSDDTESNP